MQQTCGARKACIQTQQTQGADKRLAVKLCNSLMWAVSFRPALKTGTQTPVNPAADPLPCITHTGLFARAHTAAGPPLWRGVQGCCDTLLPAADPLLAAVVCSSFHHLLL